VCPAFPYDFPKVENIEEPVALKTVIYDPDLLWNDKILKVVRGKSSYEDDLLKRKKKDTYEKHKAIERAWEIPSKFVREYEKKSSKVKRVLKRVLHR